MATATKSRKSAKSASRSGFRASWRGQLRFGLVSFEVQAINAEIKENAEVHFHLLHRPDRQRIHFAKMCPNHGEVPADENVEGYEFAKGQYVEFDKQEIDERAPTASEPCRSTPSSAPTSSIHSISTGGCIT